MTRPIHRCHSSGTGPLAGRSRLAVALAACALLVAGACGGSTTGAAKPKPDTRPRPVPVTSRAVVAYDAWLAAVATRNLEELAGLYAADATIEPMGSGKEIAGPDNIVAMYESFWDSFPDLRADVLLVLARGRTIAALTRTRGTQSVALMGIPPTGKRTSFVGLQLVTFDDEGKIIEELLYADNLNFMGQLGVVPGPHRPYDDSAAPPRIDSLILDSPTEARNVAAVRKEMELFNAHDVDALLAQSYTADAVIRNQSGPADMVGAGAIKSGLSGLFAAFSDVRVSPDQVWGAGDYVIATYLLEGTHDGAIASMSLEPSGKKIRIPGADIYRMVDGKIAEQWVVLDGMVMMMQLDALHMPIP